MACRILIALLLLPLVAATAAATDPRLTSVTPVGGQRGKTVTVGFGGNRLDTTLEIVFYDKGLSVVSFDAKRENRVVAKIRIAADCRLGEHALRIRTARGVTELRTFWVGALPVRAEKEPNGTLTQANPVPLNVTLHGTIRPEDTDVYRFDATEGQPVRIVVDGIRLGRSFLDPLVRVRDADGDLVAEADDSPLLAQDCHLAFTPHTSGVHYVELRDRAFGGANTARYRLHIGTFPQPAIAFPLAGPAGRAIDVSFLGDGPAVTRTVTPQAPRGQVAHLAFENGHGISPAPVPFRLSSLPATREKEPNVGKGRANRIAFPGAADGIIDEPGDQDWFRFRAKKNDNIEVRVFARRLGSPLDATIGIVPTKGRGLAYNDDAANHPDSFARTRIGADGDYFVHIRDRLGRGGETFVYRLEVVRTKPLVRLKPAKFQRRGQARQAVAVPAGNRTAALIDVERRNVGGALEAMVTALPPNVTARAPQLPARGTRIPVVFEATEDATPAGALAEIRASLAPKKKGEKARPVASRYDHEAELVWAQPNNALYWSRVVDRMAVAATEPVGFRVDILGPDAPLVQNGSLDLRVKVTRAKTFKGPVFVELLYNPPGTSSRRNVVIDAKKTDARIRVNANGRAPTGRWPIVVIARGTVHKGAARVSSAIHHVEIAKPFASLSFRRVVSEQGKPTKVVATIKKLRDFAGKVKAQLVRLPRGVTADRPSFAATDKEITFTVKIDAKARVGRFRNIYATVSRTTGADTSSFRTGGLDLRIDRPKPKSNAVAKKDAKAPARRSRLEALRDEQRRREAKPGGDPK